MAPNRSQVRETNISVSGVATTRETEAAEAAEPAGSLLNEGVDGGVRMGASEPPMNLDLTSESDQDFSDFLRVNNLIFLKLSKKARAINHECITSKNSKFPYAKLENLCADIKQRVPTIHSEITKDFIWENVLVWLYAMQRSFEGQHDLKYDDKFNLIASDIIAEYIHYKCNKFAKSDIASSKVVTNEILAAFCVLFERNHAYVLMTLLRINFRGCEFNEKYASVLCPIFKKYLTKKFMNQSTDFSYSRLILCFKKWKSLVHEAKQKEKINNIAMGDFNLEKYPTGLLPSVIPVKEEEQLLAIFPLYKQAKYLQAKYGRNAGTRTLLREDKSDLNKMISTYFKVFAASLKNEEDDIVWLMEELSTPLEPHQHRHQHKNGRTMRKGDNTSDNDVIVLPDDDAETNVEKVSIVENGARCSEGDSNNNRNNSVNPSEIAQKSYGAFSDISSGHEEDDLSRNEGCVPSSGTDQNGSLVNHPVQLLPLQSTNIFRTETISQIPNYHFPVVNGWSHTGETEISSTPTPSMFLNSPPNNTLFLSYHNPPNREVFVNDRIRRPEHTQQQIESDLCTTSENMFNNSILQNDQASKCANLVNTNVNELNESLGETILRPNIPASSDNLSDQIGDKTIHLPSKNVSNVSQQNSPIQCEKLKAIFMRRCGIDSDKTERRENKEMASDGQLNNVKETKTKSESITSISMKPEDSFAQNSAQSMQNKTNKDLNNISIEDTLSTEIRDKMTIAPALEAKQTPEKQLVPQKEPALVKELLSEQGLEDYPMGNERAAEMNKLLLGGVKGSKEKEIEEGNLATVKDNDPATIKNMVEAKQISEKPQALQKAEGSAKEFVWDKKRLLRERVLSKPSTPQNEPVPAKELVPEKEQRLDHNPMENKRAEDLNKPLFGGERGSKEKKTEKNTEDITKEGSLSTDIHENPATIKPITKQPALQNAEGSARELVWDKKRILKTERVRSKQSTPQKKSVTAKEVVPEKEQGLDDYPMGNEKVEDLSKPLFGGVKGSKEKETEKSAAGIAKEVSLSADKHENPPTIKPILEAKPISENQSTLQNAEGSAKELIEDKKRVLKTDQVRSKQSTPQKKPVPAKEEVPEKEQGLDDYPMGNERAEDLSKPLFGGVKGSKEKETEKSTQDIAKEFSLSADIHENPATIKPIVEAKPISENQPTLQNAEGSAKELVWDKKRVLKKGRVRSKQSTPQKKSVTAKEVVPENEQDLDDYPMGNEKVEDLSKPLFGGVRGSKEKETEKTTENMTKEVSLSADIHENPATIKPIAEAKQISEKQPALQNAEGSAKELVWDKKRVPKSEGVRSKQSTPQKKPVAAKEVVPEKEQGLDDYPMGNEKVEGLSKPLFGGVRGSKEKETEKSTGDIAKEESLSSDIHENPATIKPIVETKQISEKQPALQNAEGSAKELVWDKKRVPKSEGVRSKQSTTQKKPVAAKEVVPEKEQGLDDYPMGNEKVEGLSKPLFGGVRGSKEKETEKSTGDIAKEESLSSDIHENPATIKPIVEAKQISEKQPALQNAEGSAKELVWDKKRVPKSEGVQSKQSTPQKKPVAAKEVVPEKEQGIDDYPMGNEKVEGLIKPLFGGVRGSKEKETEKSTGDIAKEVSLSSDIHENPATIKPIAEAKQTSEKQPALQNVEGSAKELVWDKKRVPKSEGVRSKQSTPQKKPVAAKEVVPEKEQGIDDYPMGNEKVEGLIKPLFGGVRGSKEKETEKSTGDIAKEVSLSSDIHENPATIKPIAEAKQTSEKQPALQNVEGSAKELVWDKKRVPKSEGVRSKQSTPQKKPVAAEEVVPEKDQGLDDYPMGNEKVEGLSKPLFGGVRISKEKETEKSTGDIAKEVSLSSDIHENLATIKPIVEAKQISEKQPALQNAEGSAKILVCDKKRGLKSEEVRSKQSTPQKKPVVPEKEQGLDDYSMGNEKVDDLRKPLFGGVRDSKEKESEKSTGDIPKEVSLSADIHEDPATIKSIIEAKQISEKQPALQNAEGSAKELVWDKKRVPKSEGVRSKQSTPQKKPVAAKEVVPEKEQGLDDYPMGNEKVEALSKPLFAGVRGSKEKETEKSTEEKAKEGSLSADIHENSATIKPILEAKQISENQPALQNAAGSAKELVWDKKRVPKSEGVRSKQSTPQKKPVAAKEVVPEKEQGLDDYPMGNEKVEALSKPLFAGVRGSKEKETEKSTEEKAKEGSLSADIHENSATIKPIAKQISEKLPALQNAEGSAKELVCDRKRVLRERGRTKQPTPQKKPVPAKEVVPEKEQVVDYPMQNKRAEDLSKPHFEGVRGSKEKETEKSTEEIAKEVSLSTVKHENPATIKPITKQPAPQNAEGSGTELVWDKTRVLRERVLSKPSTPQNEPVPAKELVPGKEQRLDRYQMENKRAKDLSKSLFGGVRGSKEKVTERKNENMTKEGSLSADIHESPATIKPIVEAKQISEKQPALQNAEGSANEMGCDKKRVLRERGRTKQPTPQREPVPTKEVIPEKEQVLDYPMQNKRAEDLSKPHFEGLRGSKEKETEKSTKEKAKEVSSSTNIHENSATIKPIAKQISETQPALQNAEGSAKELVCDKKRVLRERGRTKQPTPQKKPVPAKEVIPEKEQVLDYPMQNKRAEDLSKPHFEGVRGSKEKEAEKSTEEIAKEVSLSTVKHENPATIKPITKQPALQNAEGSGTELVWDKTRVLRERVLSKPSTPQNEPVPAKELVPGKEQRLDRYQMENKRAKDLSKSLFGGVRGSKEKGTERKNEDMTKEGSLSADIHENPATIKPIVEVKQISEKQPALQNVEGSAKELVCDKKRVLNTEGVRLKQSTPQKNPVAAKELVSEKEQRLDHYPKENKRAEDLSKSVFGGVRGSKGKETEKNTEDVAKKVSLPTNTHDDSATIKPILEAKQISEKQPALQTAEGSARELVRDKKRDLKTEGFRSKQSTPQKKPVPAKESVTEKGQVLVLLKAQEIAEIRPTQPVLKPEQAGGSKTKTTKRRRKSTSGQTKSKKQKIQAENGPASTLQDAIGVLRFQPKNNLQALQSMLVDEVEDSQESQNNIDKTNIVTVPEEMALTHMLNSDVDIIRVSEAGIDSNIAQLVTKPLNKPITDEELIRNTFVYGRNNDPNLTSGEFLSQRNNTENVITSETNYSTKVKTLTQTPKNEIDVNLEQVTEQNKNLVQNSLGNEAQHVDRDCDIILMEKIDTLLARSESLNKIKPENDNLQNSQTPERENIENEDVLAEQTKNDDILKSLELKKVEHITKPAQCVNKPEELQTFKQQLKNITNKGFILKASVDEDRKSPTVLQEVQQEDIKSMQLLNVESKIQKPETEETTSALEIFKMNSTNDIEDHFPIGVPSPQSNVDKADAALDIDDDSSSPSFSPLSNSSQIIDDDVKKSPFYEKRNEIIEDNDEIPLTSTCFLSNNEMTNILQNSDENLPASLIAQLDDTKPTIMTNSEIFGLLPELDGDQTPITLASEVPKSVTTDEESDKFQNFNWTGQVDLYNISDNGNKTTSNPDYSDNLIKILELIDSTYTAAHLNTSNQGGRTGVKDVMCTPLLEATATEKRVPNGTSQNFCVLFGHSSIVVTQKPFNGENSVIPGNGEDFFLLSASTDEAKENTFEKYNVNEKNNIASIISTDNNSYQSTPVQCTSVQPTLVQPSLVQPTLVQPSLVQPALVQPALVQPALVQPALVQPALVQPSLGQRTSAQTTFERFTTPVTPKITQPTRASLKVIPKNDKKLNDKNNIETKSNVIGSDQSRVLDLSTLKNFTPHVESLLQPVPVQTAPLPFALRRRNANKLGTDKSKIEVKNVPEVKVVHGDVFEYVKNTPPPSQNLYKGNGTVTIQRKVGDNICKFAVKDGRKRFSEPFKFQPVTDAQLLEQLREEKRRKLQS